MTHLAITALPPNTASTARESARDPSTTNSTPRLTSNPRSRRSATNHVASVLFSVLPSTTASGSFRPSAVTPSAPTSVWPAKPKPSMNTISQR